MGKAVGSLGSTHVATHSMQPRPAVERTRQTYFGASRNVYDDVSEGDTIIVEARTKVRKSGSEMQWLLDEGQNVTPLQGSRGIQVQVGLQLVAQYCKAYSNETARRTRGHRA